VAPRRERSLERLVARGRFRVLCRTSNRG